MLALIVNLLLRRKPRTIERDRAPLGGRVERRWSLIVLIWIVMQAAGAATPARIRVVMDDNYPPFAFRDNEGHLQGISVDQWQLWQQRTGIAVELTAMNWNDALRRMRAGEFDVIDTIFQTPERSVYLSFTEPYARVDVPIFFAKDIPGITDPESLRGFAVAVKAADASAEPLRKAGATNLLSFSSYEAMVLAARDHKINVFVMDRPAALYLLNKHGLTSQFRETAPISTGMLRRAVARDNKALLQTINDGFSRISDEERRSVDNKWFGQPLNASDIYWPFLMYFGAATLVIIFILLAWSMSLRRLVSRRTAALSASESQLRAMLNAEPEMVCVLDNNRRIVEMNSAGLAILQAESLSQTQAADFLDYIMPAHREALQSLHRQVMSGVSGRLELELRGLHGARSWLVLHAVPLIRSENEPALLVVAHNITERKRAEELRLGQMRVTEMIASGAPLHETVAMLMRTIEAQVQDLACSVLLVDRDNKTLKHIAAPGLPKAAIQAIDGQSIGEKMGSCGTAAFTGKSVFTTDIATDPLWGDFRSIILPHGFKACWSTPLFDAQHQVIATFAIYSRHIGLPQPEHLQLMDAATHTLTVCINHYLTEQALRDSEERFRQVVENIDEVFWVRDSLEDKMLYVSPPYERIWGRSCHSLLMDSDSWMDPVIPEDRERVQLVARQRRQSGISDVEYRIMHTNGEQRWIHTRTFPVRNERGEVFRLAGVSRDVTEARALAEQMRQAQKMEAIGTLAGGIAHDFNNLLTAINGNAELALQSHGDTESLSTSLQEILKAGLRARSLVQQILLFTRSQQQVRDIVDLGALLQEVQGFLKATLPASVEVKVAIADAVPRVSADATQIYQVVLNLCMNAWQALPSSQGCIEIGLTHEIVNVPEVHPYANLPAGIYACITVQDNGCGMDEVTQRRMFEPFFTTKAAGQGTGLGLAMVQGIMQSHDGIIVVSSRVGQGTEVKLYIPTTADQLTTELKTAAEVPYGVGQRIMYLDDEESLVLLVTRMLRQRGYRVSGFNDPEAALQAFMAHPNDYDLIVTDYNMAGMTGLSFAQQVLTLRKMPVLLTSGYITEELQQRANDIGVKHLLYKPSSMQEFCAAISAILADESVAAAASEDDIR